MGVPKPPQAEDVIESEEILQYVSLALLKIDYNDTQVKSIIIGVTFVFFLIQFIASLFICKLFKAFRSLRKKHQVFMSLAITRGTYGILGVIFGAHALFCTTNLDRDVVFGKSASSSMAMFITVGFFIFELSAVVLSDLIFKSFSKMLITHHGLALVAYTLAISMGANFSFGCKALILEMSTPFSCLCFMLLKAGMENSVFWRVNQFVLVHTFHLRSVVECHLWYITYMNWQVIYTYMPTSIFVLLYANLILVTFMMTPYWGYKKTQQLFNPVDWNFQESRTTDFRSNGVGKKMI